MINVLIVGPWIGEIGVEITRWQNWARAYKKARHQNDYCIAVGYPGRAILYRDFVNEYWDIPDFFLKMVANKEVISNYGGLIDGQTHQDMSNDSPVIMVMKNWIKEEAAKRFPNDNVMFLNTYLDMMPPGFNETVYPTIQTFFTPMLVENVRLQSNKIAIIPDGKKLVVVTSRVKDVDTCRNWPSVNWEKLVGMLLQSGYVVSIHGTQYDTAKINIQDDNLINNVGVDLETQAAYLQKAQLTITSISGAMFIAMYSGCPIVSFGAQYRAAEASMQRALGTPVYILTHGDSWDYSPEELFDFAKPYLEK